MSAATIIRQLLQPPTATSAQEKALQFIDDVFGREDHVPPSSASHLWTGGDRHEQEKLKNVADGLLGEKRRDQVRLEEQFRTSQADLHALITETKATLQTLQTRTQSLHAQHLQLEDEISDHRDVLVSKPLPPPSQTQTRGTPREDTNGFDGLLDALRRPSATTKDESRTLVEQLQSLDSKLKELEDAREWYQVVEKAERLGLQAKRLITMAGTEEGKGSSALAIETYMELCRYSQDVETDKGKKAEEGNKVSGTVKLMHAIVSDTWEHMKGAIADNLLAALDDLKWPKPMSLDRIIEESKVSRFNKAFSEALNFDWIEYKNPLPSPPEVPSEPSIRRIDSKPAQPLFPVEVLVHPLILRFRYHFDSDRATNRLDKPEWYFVHILNLLSEHERFIQDDVQDLVSRDSKFSGIDAFTDFTTLLLRPLNRKLRQSIPQLLSLPPILAHTIYQALEFDQTLKDKWNYRPRVLKREGDGQTETWGEGEWEGLADVILGRKEWFDKWLGDEKTFVDDKYFEIIGSDDAWQINEDYAESGLRPTNSAMRTRDLFDQVTDRYRPLPSLRHRLKFLTAIQLPLLSAYHTRISSSVDAFETLTFGLIRAVPGALGDGGGGRMTAGMAGLQRLLRACVSSMWMQGICKEWGEDFFFVELWHDICNLGPADEAAGAALAALANLQPDANKGKPLDRDGLIFDGISGMFRTLTDRIEDLIVKHLVREVTTELKPYFNKRWDYAPPMGDEDLQLSPELLSSLTLYSAFLSTISTTLPAIQILKLHRSLSSSLTEYLINRVCTNRIFSESGGKQFLFDVQYGWSEAVKESIRVGQPVRNLTKLRDTARILALPAAASGSGGLGAEGMAGGSGGGSKFSKVMRVVWSDSDDEGERGGEFRKVMEEVGVETLGRKEVMALLRKRPECWR